MIKKYGYIMLVLVIGLTLVWAQDEEAAKKARLEKYDKGPKTIDVSKYPKEIQENYKKFSQKCSQCHTLARPINSDYALPDEWERYVKRMMHKPGSGINNTDGKDIYEFLTYDSYTRKKSMVDDKLSKATSEEKKAAEDKFKEIKEKYQDKKSPSK